MMLLIFLEVIAKSIIGIERSGDKGVSAGEGTNLEVVNTSISESNLV